MSVPETAYLSLGSNLGDRAANLGAAVAELQSAGRVLAVSAFYETQPVDVPDQPWFLNCVAAIETGKSPRELLSLVLNIEAGMGRVRMREKGPRIIDIDIVLFGDQVIDEPGYCAFYYPNANCQNMGPGNPNDINYRRRAAGNVALAPAGATALIALKRPRRHRSASSAMRAR